VKKKAMAVVAGLGTISALLSACGGDDGDGGGGGDGEVTQVRMSYDGDDYMNQMSWIVADEKFWPELGFDEPAEVTASPEYLAGLIGGDVWIAQGESDVIWSAIAEGSVDLTIVGVAKDAEAWWMGVREGVDPENLEGLKISGGATGDRNIQVAEHILEGMGVDPADMEFVPVSGGSDERLLALLAKQIDVAQLQPRHQVELEAAGGQMISTEFREIPQEVWVVRTDFLEDNKDAVCDYIQGRIESNLYAGAGAEHIDNREAVIELVKEAADIEPTEGEIDDWTNEFGTQIAVEAGSSEESFDAWNADMIENENVPADFDWREHVDFTCLTEVQEELGLEVEPGNID
jgi:ABC-type nitrate/sulfonate/bicarbonate transport system substrate-binding protein